LFEHFPPILVVPRVGMLFPRARGLVLIGIADGDNIFRAAMLNIAAALAAGTHAADAEFLALSGNSWLGFGNRRKSGNAGAGQGGVIQEPTAGEGGRWKQRIFIRHNVLLAR